MWNVARCFAARVFNVYHVAGVCVDLVNAEVHWCALLGFPCVRTAFLRVALTSRTKLAGLTKTVDWLCCALHRCAINSCPVPCGGLPWRAMI